MVNRSSTTLRTWTKDDFVITTDRHYVSLPFLRSSFSTPSMYWATPLPDTELETLVQNSLCFSLLKAKAHIDPTQDDQIGFARVITDYVTFAYLTDVYVTVERQGLGLGTWLIQCVGNYFDKMPHLRRAMLVTSDVEGGRGEQFYRENLGMGRVERGIVLNVDGPGAVPGWERRRAEGSAEGNIESQALATK